MEIGKIKISSPIFLAPMAGVTDYACRILSKEMGAGVVYSEFVSSDGIIRENQKTLDLIRFHDEERPIGIQIFATSSGYGDSVGMRDSPRPKSSWPESSCRFFIGLTFFRHEA